MIIRPKAVHPSAMKRRQEDSAMGIELVDALPGLVATALPDGRTDFINQGWTKYTGLSTKDALGDGWLKVVHPDDCAQVLAAWRHSLDIGQGGAVEARVRRHDGVYRWFLLRVNPIRDESGQIIKWCGINTDIERQKRAEAAVSAHEKRLGLIVDGLPTIVILMTPQGEIYHASRYTLEYAGTTVEHLKAWRTNELIHPEDRQKVIDAWDNAARTEAPYDLESRHRRADGAYRWFHVRGFPLRDDTGHIILWYFLQTDIDERKRAEALLAGEKRLLEMVAIGLPLDSILDGICRLVDEIDGTCHSSIMLIDPCNKTFQRGGASTSISGYINSLLGLCIAGGLGPCAMAGVSKSPVIVEDAASDPRWSSRWRDLSLAHGVHACWSTPILSRANKALGTFAIFPAKPGKPTPLQRELIGRLTHITSIAIERARSDVTLKRSEEGFRAIFDTTPECVKVLAPDGTILQVNAASVTMGGVHSPEMLIGASFFDFVAPEHRQAYVDFHREVCAGKKGIKEFDLMTAQGERRHIETYAAPIQLHDGRVAHLGVTRDITVRRQVEDELRRREALMAKAQRISSSGSFCWHVDSGEIIWSEELYRIFEIAPGMRITLELIAEHHHPGDLHLVRDMNERTQAGLDFEYEHRIEMPGGSIKYLYTQAHATRDQQGRLEYIGATQDVTQRRQSDEALSRLRAELAHVSRVNSLGALTASIAHEINQPLGGIIANATTGLSLLDMYPLNVEGMRETYRRTLRDGRRAADVVKRLRAMYSKKVVMSDAVDLNEAAHEVVDLLRSEMRRHRIVLQMERAPALPPVMGDRVQLQQVMLNLLLNAIEAMHDVDNRPRQLLVRTERGAGEQVQLAVCDTGPGIDPQHADRLFNAFYTTKREGMGIGLSVSRSIIESHRGRLWAEPNQGPGATFSFSIPCLADGATAAGPVSYPLQLTSVATRHGGP
jgi:PAS domain S-box-containing protein